MRDLKDCQAEVFRRSEEKIKNRQKTRRQLLAWCVPFAACAAICAVVALPPAVSDKSTFDGVSSELTGGQTNESYVCSYSQVTIQHGDSVKIVTDKVAVTKLFETVFAYEQNIGQNPSANKNNESADEHYASSAGCIILFETEDGSQTALVLSGNELKNETKNTKIFLSDTQRAELLAALGING